MTEYLRPPEEHFAQLQGFSYAARYHAWRDLRMHYVDEGPADGPVVLLTHGMPTWSYLYRDVIPPLVAAGYRCIAPDHIGFGRSDKPVDPNWYSYPRHVEVLTTLIAALDLTDVTLVCQDWGGPIGLAQVTMMPERFARLVVMNTWLHHDAYTYSDGALNWIRNWNEGGLFDRPRPNIAALMLMSAGVIERDTAIAAFVEGGRPRDLGEDAAAMYEAFEAPVKGLPDAAFAAYRRFPLSIPVDGTNPENAALQAHVYRTLRALGKPASFIWGCADDVFDEAWGRAWAAQMDASFDAIAEAGHFLQNTHGEEVARLILARIGAR